MNDKTMQTHHQTGPMRCRRLAVRTNLALSALALTLLALVSPAKAIDDAYERAPELPSPLCDKVNAPEGNRVSSHVYALGVQIYQWNGTSWTFIGPEAALFEESCYETQVGIHYGDGGPTWEANDGSVVKAARVDGCTPFRGAIPWLLLKKTSTSGEGRFARISFIQRVNTIGGTAPAEAGAFVGDEARVPYTTEYYFYRETKN
jgi:hypothetical protein